MSGVDGLNEVLTGSGPWSHVYVDGPGDEPQSVEADRRRSVRDRLLANGAPEADADEIEAALAERGGLPAPSARYLVVRDGVRVIDEQLEGARRGPERIGYGAVPEILPLLRHREHGARYLVVETGREGASVALLEIGRAAEVSEQEVSGRDDSLPKVRAGGRSNPRYQRHSEELWAETQGEVAEAVDRLVREQHPAFLVVAGDVRARQLLAERLSEQSRELLVDVDAHLRAAGSDEERLEQVVWAELAARQAAEDARAREDAAVDDGSRGAHGTEQVVAALQGAQVDRLLLDARLLDTPDTVEALDAPPWVALSAEDELSAGCVARVPLAEGLARAAVLSDARVIVVDEEPDDGEPRSDAPPAEPLAALRWAASGA